MWNYKYRESGLGLITEDERTGRIESHEIPWRLYKRDWRRAGGEREAKWREGKREVEWWKRSQCLRQECVVVGVGRGG